MQVSNHLEKYHLKDNHSRYTTRNQKYVHQQVWQVSDKTLSYPYMFYQITIPKALWDQYAENL